MNNINYFFGCELSAGKNICLGKFPKQIQYLLESWFWEMLKGRPSEILIPGIAIVIQVSLEVINL